MKTPHGTMRAMRRAALKGVDLKTAFPEASAETVKAVLARKAKVLKKGFLDEELFTAQFERDAYYAKHGGRPASEKKDEP